MKFTHKKSLTMLINNPQITLFLVIYLMFAGIIVPNILLSQTKAAFYTFSFLLLMFSTAFFAGWFGFIKGVVTLKNDKDINEKLENLKSGFFGSIPVYFFPILLLIIIFMLIQTGIPNVASILFGKTDAILMQIASLTNDKNAIANYITTLPEVQKKMLIERSLFIITASVSFYILFFYTIPALYFNKTPNVITGIVQNFKAVFKKFFPTIYLFFLILLIHLVLFFFEVISASLGQIFMFIALVLRVCFIAYIIVLIFSIYEENFGNNGGDSLGEN